MGLYLTVHVMTGDRGTMFTIDCDSMSKTALDSGQRPVIISSSSIFEENSLWFVTNPDEMDVSKKEWKKSLRKQSQNW